MGSSPPPHHSASSPDLSNNSQDDEQPLFGRKRKTPDDDYLLSSLRDQIANLTIKLDNSMKVLRHDLTSEWRESHTKVNNAISTELQAVKTNTQAIKDQLVGVQSDLTEMKNTIHTLDTKLKKTDSDVNNMKKQLKEHSDDLKKLQSEELKNSGLCKSFQSSTDTKLQEITAQLQQLEQRDRMNNLEISGVPVTRGENLMNLLHTLCVKIGVTLTPYDVDRIHRVRKFPTKQSEGKPADYDIPNIIIRFARRRPLNEVLAACKSRRGITTAELGFDGPAKPVFVNQHLAPHNKALYRNARDAAKKLAYQFIWIKDSKIFVRKNETSKVIHIGTESDLKKI
ncbi:hypothetical protein NE865_00446 [Phthorimaea operculella]|nr:hypothetical protein NE865_00446 [Phthorimaea operculella]